MGTVARAQEFAPQEGFLTRDSSQHWFLGSGIRARHRFLAELGIPAALAGGEGTGK